MFKAKSVRRSAAGAQADFRSQAYFFFSTLAAKISDGLVLVPFTLTVVPLTTSAQVASSNFVVALVVTVVAPTVNVNAGHA